MTSPDNLLAAIIADPANDDLRLVFADLLDDRGEGERAEFIRVQCELAHCSLDEDSAKRMASFSHNPNSVGYALEIVKKRRRERELFEQNGWQWVPKLEGEDSGTHDSIRVNGRDIKFKWVRGFISSLTCTYADWAQHADAITARCPIERVALTTWPEVRLEVYDGSGPRATIDGVKSKYQPHHESNSDMIRELFSREWPRITFTLPSEVAV